MTPEAGTAVGAGGRLGAAGGAAGAATTLLPRLAGANVVGDGLGVSAPSHLGAMLAAAAPKPPAPASHSNRRRPSRPRRASAPSGEGALMARYLTERWLPLAEQCPP